MVSQQIKNGLTYIGDRLPTITKTILNKIEENGLVAGNVAERLLSVLIVVGAAWLILHFANSLKTPVKLIIKIVAILLIVSIAFSTFTQ